MNLVDFLHAHTYSGKLKFNSYWVDMVKYGQGLLGHETLKSAISQKQIGELR